MTRVRRSWLLVLLMAAICLPCRAEEAPGKTEQKIVWPSPDGEFAFLQKVEPGFEREGTVDLIEQKTKKVLWRVEEEINVGWSALWAPSSRRVVVTSRVGHAIQGIDVYVRRGDTFEAVELPDLEARVPEKMMRGKKFPHFANLNYATAVRWNKDGTLSVEIVTMQDGAGAMVSATRKVVLGFDRAGKARIVKSSTTYESSKE